MADVTSKTGAGYSGADRTPIPDGWLLFSALMILWIGVWNIFQGIFAFFRSAFFIGHPVGGALWIWAILWIVFGVLQMAAGGAIMSHRSWGRWFGIVTVGLSLFLNLLAISTYPWWSVVLVAIDVFILFGLTVHWRESRGAAI